MRKYFILLIVLSLSLLKAQTPRIVPIDSIQGYRSQSPYVNQTVTTMGIVTATTQDWVRYIKGFFIQDAEAPWHGIYVYTGNLTVSVERGDSVMVTGRVTEYYNLTEISPTSSSDIVILKKGAKIPKPLKIPCSDLNTEPYEGVLVRIDSVTVVNNNVGNYQFQVQDPAGNTALVQNCAGFTYNPNNGDFIPSIVGVDYYSYGAFKIVPRRNQDLIFQGDGTGYFYFENNIFPAGDERPLSLICGTYSPFTITGIKLIVPQGFTLMDSVTLSGPAFLNATLDTISDTIVIQNVSLTERDTGIVTFKKIRGPNTPGYYPFKILTLSQSNYTQIPDLPQVQLVSIIGGGSAGISPYMVPKGSPSQIAIQINNIFGTLRQIKVILPSVPYHWGRGLTLLGSGFTGATYNLNGDTITILNCTIDSANTGQIVLQNFTFNDDSFPIATFKVLTGTTDSVGEIPNHPQVFIATQDTIVKMKFFHDPSTKGFLLGKTVNVKGVVTGIIGDRTYIQDTTGGLIVYRGPQVTQNTEVKLTGQYGEYRSSSQLYSAVLVQSYGTSFVEPESLSAPPLEAQEGKLVKAFELTPPQGLSTFIPESTLVFRDSLNREYRIFVSSTTNLAYKPVPQGKIDVTGCVYQFDSYYIIQPRSTRDIVAKGNGTGEFTLNPAYTYYDSVRNISLIIKSPYNPIRSMELKVRGAAIDTLSFKSAGFVNPVIDSFYKDSSIFYIKISGGIQLTEDTLTLVGLKPLNNVESVNFDIKTSVDSGGYLSPVLTNPILFVATPIGYARRNGPDGYTPEFLNQTFTVVGVVTAPPSVFSTTRTSMYIQDETGGINVYYSGGYVGFNVGDLVRVKGSILQYNGLTEISPASSQDMVLLDQNYPVQPMILPKGRMIDESLEGWLVQVEGTCENTPYASGSGKTFTIYNGMVPVPVYVYNTTNIDLQRVSPGYLYRVVGVVGQYDNTAPYTGGYQLLPRFQSDIELIAPVAQEEVNLNLSPNVFSPALGEALRIDVQGPADATSNLKIFSTSGRLVKAIALGKKLPYSLEWRGDDDKGSLLPPGLYILLLEYTTPDGKSRKVQKTVVISKPK